jgi:hypothetical protein
MLEDYGYNLIITYDQKSMIPRLLTIHEVQENTRRRRRRRNAKNCE